MAKLTMVKALNLALRQEMERDDDVLIIGEDVGVDGGVFRVTEDLHRKFGSRRVIDSPLAEAAIIGASVGMALYGLKPVCEIQFSGFAFQCFHQIENHAARYRNRSQGRFHVPMVIRMPYGGGVRALEHHSESEEQFYAHIPGLKMVVPSGPRNARALLTAAIRDPDPVVFFEHKGLYHAAKEDVPDESETLELGRARVAREGRDLTLIAWGAMVRLAAEAAETLEAEDRVSCEIVDVLTIAPPFVAGIDPGDGEESALARTIIDLAASLHMSTIAEGIEERGQLELLRELGCEQGQGYLFARPLDADAVTALLDAELVEAPA